MHLEHPNHVVALSAVYAPGSYDPADTRPPLICIGSLSVERLTDTEARFHATHKTFDPRGDPADPLTHVSALLDRRSFVIGCAADGDDAQGLAYQSIDHVLPGTAHVQTARRQVINAAESQLARIARSSRLIISGEPVPHFQQQCEAGNRAQAVWLTFLQFCTDPQERAFLHSAWQAWAVLQNAAIPF